ncbi:uncharacterized protein LOC101758965 [Setaria italica]|uniref:uncharacterized protein LOC101758965 n=1 Tax=Setaria italica TaxID=4555 RepID=UPI000BE4BFD0|nr:uncharacterized protein LOC101758965 [Setaria italica]
MDRKEMARFEKSHSSPNMLVHARKGGRQYRNFRTNKQGRLHSVERSTNSFISKSVNRVVTAACGLVAQQHCLKSPVNLY